MRGQGFGERVHEFELTEDHIILIQNMHVGWQDCEYGAPEIDPKRPYGNSNVDQDIHELLGWEYPDEEEMTPGEYDKAADKAYERARKIHEETKIALQILFDNIGKDVLPLGKYDRREYGGDWRRKVD